MRKILNYRSKQELIITLLLLLITTGSGLVFYFFRFLEPVAPYQVFSREVHIEKGYSSRQIAEKLEEKELIRSSLFFQLVIRLTGRAPYLQAGSYHFSSSQSLWEIVEDLVKGRVVTRGITIPEGYTVLQIANLLEKEIDISSASFLEAVNSRDLYSFLEGVYSVEPYYYLEGYLFPDTYHLSSETSPEEIVQLMLNRLWDYVEDYTVRQRARQLDLNLHQVLTIASMIEDEARYEEERALISGVIHNRLKKGMPLQIDATIQYLLPERKVRILYQDLRLDSPYNLYLYDGLPPGPISNPGISSILAALYPVRTDYLYYVARDDGTHIFSHTYQEHLEAQRRIEAGQHSPPEDR